MTTPVVRQGTQRPMRTDPPAPKAGENNDQADSWSLSDTAKISNLSSTGSVGENLDVSGRNYGMLKHAQSLSMNLRNETPSKTKSKPKRPKNGNTVLKRVFNKSAKNVSSEVAASAEVLKNNVERCEAETRKCLDMHNAQQVKADARAKAWTKCIGTGIGLALGGLALGFGWPILGGIIAGAAAVGALCLGYAMVVTLGAQPIKFALHVTGTDGRLLLRTQNQYSNAQKAEKKALRALNDAVKAAKSVTISNKRPTIREVDVENIEASRQQEECSEEKNVQTLAEV